MEKEEWNKRRTHRTRQNSPHLLFLGIGIR